MFNFQGKNKNGFCSLLTIPQHYNVSAFPHNGFFFINIQRSDGGGSFQAVDRLNGKLLCNCGDLHACVVRLYINSLRLSIYTIIHLYENSNDSLSFILSLAARINITNMHSLDNQSMFGLSESDGKCNFQSGLTRWWK